VLEFEAFHVTVGHLIRHWPVLRTLKVKDIQSNCHWSACEFSSLQNLTFTNPSSESSSDLLWICTNLVNLHLCTPIYNDDYKYNFPKILLNNSVIPLERKSLGYFHGTAPFESLIYFILICNSLKNVKVFGDSYTDLKTLFHCFFEVKVLPDLYLNILYVTMRTKWLYFHS